MSIQKALNLLSFTVLIVFAIHLIVKIQNDIKWIVVGVFIGLPLIVSFIVGLFKKRLFYIFFPICTTLMLLVLLYIKTTPTSYDSEHLKQSSVTQEYFSDKAGFFTPFSPIVIFNQDADSTYLSKDTIVKCVYQTGSKADNYYIGKIKIEGGKVTKEFYNKRVIDDPTFATREFGQTLNRIQEVKQFLK
jgi:energy-coupling factor transporter transmembrane protein EcfT